jgi:hypothetical protein
MAAILNFRSANDPPNDYSCKVTIQLVWWFLTRRFSRFQPIRTVKKLYGFLSNYLFNSPGYRPRELLSWVSVRRPSVRPLDFHIYLFFSETAEQISTKLAINVPCVV